MVGNFLGTLYRGESCFRRPGGVILEQMTPSGHARVLFSTQFVVTDRKWRVTNTLDAYPFRNSWPEVAHEFGFSPNPASPGREIAALLALGESVQSHGWFCWFCVSLALSPSLSLRLIPPWTVFFYHLQGAGGGAWTGQPRLGPFLPFPV